MKFTPDAIKKEAMSNSQGYLGTWDSKPLYGTTYEDAIKNGVYGKAYLAYDKPELPIIIINKNGDAYIMGNVIDDKGSVRTCHIPMPCERTYTGTNPKPKHQSVSSTPIDDSKEDIVIGDVYLGLVVDDTLANARTKTIDSLLEGFLQ